jgi:class 3 adenylate cyclase
MIPQTETRKLAAVMFVDIEGYTSLFQQNESAAIKQVNDHRKDLEETTRKYKGDIIQFYGDGSATVFDSVIDAVRSATELQQKSILERIPIRIGIHMGDLIFKERDIFGDVVNVTSRIQSAGISGSILISRKVVDELANHPEVQTKRLGLYTLKNVKEQLELFALTEPGLKVPPLLHVEIKKRALTVPNVLMIVALVIIAGYFLGRDFFRPKPFKLGDELICIPPFVDHTLNTDYAEVGKVASSLMNKALTETKDANVVSYESLIRYFNSDLSALLKNPALARKTGADYSFNGHYTLKGKDLDTLYFWASILDLRTNKTLEIEIPTFSCSARDYFPCIENMINVLKGYWRSKDAHVFKIPNDKAWSAYLKAQDLWVDPASDSVNAARAKEYLLQAIAYDSSFLDAYFLLLDGFNNANQFKNEADTIQIMKKRFPDLEGRQDAYLRYYEEDLKGNNPETFKYFMKGYIDDPKDLLLNTTGMVLALEYLNDPETVLEFHQQIDIDSLDLNACTYCRTRASMALQAYINLADTANARKMVALLAPYTKDFAHFIRLISYYSITGDTASINAIIERAPTLNSAYKIQEFCYRMAAQYAFLNNKTESGQFYARKVITLYGDKPNWQVGRSYYLIGNLIKAQKIYQAEIGKYPNDKWLKGELGVIYADQKNKLKANEMISAIESLKTDYDYGLTSYLQGKIQAHLGEEESALRYFKKALDEGMKFEIGAGFQHDPDLMIMNSNPEYQKLLVRNRQPVDINKK